MLSPSSNSQLYYCLTNGGFNYEQYYYQQQQQQNGGVFDDEKKNKNKNKMMKKKKNKKIVDRHSKIWTAQGVRDRRVRLSVEIAQEFFHLQDMLGFDRASKTLEWLLANSRNAINDLLAAPNNNNNPPNPTGSGLPTYYNTTHPNP